MGVISLTHKEGRTADFVIKEFRTQGVDKLKSAFLPSKASKAWRGGVALLERGIETPFPTAYIEKKRRLFLDQSFYLSKMVSEVEEIRFLFRNLPQEELQNLCEELALHLSLCHTKGILHRDLSDGNILVKKDESGEFKFYLIDTNRIRIKKRLGVLRRIRNLIRLGVPRLYQRFFLQRYLGIPEVNQYLWFWYRANKIVFTWYVELKNKLRLKIVAQKLKIQ